MASVVGGTEQEPGAVHRERRRVDQRHRKDFGFESKRSRPVPSVCPHSARGGALYQHQTFVSGFADGVRVGQVERLVEYHSGVDPPIAVPVGCPDGSSSSLWCKRFEKQAVGGACRGVPERVGDKTAETQTQAVASEEVPVAIRPEAQVKWARSERIGDHELCVRHSGGTRRRRRLGLVGAEVGHGRAGGRQPTQPVAVVPVGVELRRFVARDRRLFRRSLIPARVMAMAEETASRPMKVKVIGADST